MLRRVIFILAAFYLIDVSTSLQIIIIHMTNFLSLIYIGKAESYEMKLKNRLDLFNETGIMFVTMHLFFFSELVPDVEMQY